MNWREFIRQTALLAIQSARYFTQQTSVTWDDKALDTIEKFVQEYIGKVGQMIPKAGSEGVVVRDVLKEVAAEQGVKFKA